MFSWKEFNQRKEANLKFEQAIETLIESIEVLKNQKKVFDSGCTHGLILHFGKEGLWTEPNGYAQCLCCRKTFTLPSLTEAIDEENIIDLVGVISDDYLCTYKGKENVLTTRAIKYLESIKDKSEHLHLEDIKQLVIQDLIEFVEEEERKMAHVPVPTSAEYIGENNKPEKGALGIISGEDILKRTRK